ncbi:MAG: Saccharopine dehydrogenase [Trizodia sp. TS-e1964]|nr:MAG: Saccharopine dehydrogenase [Trizodia sp. TS-e1964]
MEPVHLHLRSECKPLEYRSALTPTTTRALVDAGYIVYVEKSPSRIFEDSEFEAAGAILVPENSWRVTECHIIIIGLKELSLGVFYRNAHIYFAHCYKRQSGWEDVLNRFRKGGGMLYDLEFLTDDSGRRVAAFGYHAGFAGAALAIKAWAHQLTHTPDDHLTGITPYSNESLLLDDIRAALQIGTAASPTASPPRVLIIGALGRCGRGAVELCQRAGLDDSLIIQWDMAETAKGGPFPEITASDIFINCIYLTSSIAPFISAESLAQPGRKLSVVCDVSCDTTNPHNPIPIYDVNTTFDRPTVPVVVAGEPALSVISIDHLPSLLPREASEAFSAALLPSLLELKNRETARVWKDAEALFHEKMRDLEEMEAMDRLADGPKPNPN